MRKREKLSFSKSEARRLYESSDKKNREIARLLGVSEKSVRNWADEGGWQRNSAPLPQQNPQIEAPEQPVTLGEAAAKVAAEIQCQAVRSAEKSEPRTAQEIARDFCGTVDVLREEIDVVVRNLHLIRDLAEADLDAGGDKASEARRKLVNKVLELPGLVKASNDLTAALSRLTEADPGKKEQRAANAKQVGSVGRFATPAAPAGQTTH